MILGTGSVLAVPADDSANNTTDQNASAITPLDQSNDSADLKITQRIRRAVVKDQDLSVDAHNIKIITTKDHTVYLRGPVASDEERSKIESLAKMKAAGYQLNNELTVASK